MEPALTTSPATADRARAPTTVPAPRAGRDRAPVERAVGNQARLRRLQAKLAVGAVNDPLEREADAVADRVMRMADPAASLAAAAPLVSRKCAACEEEDAPSLQREAAGGALAGGGEAPAAVAGVLNTPGRPLDPATHAFMSQRFGADFGGVRIHTDAAAADSAREVGALAYTVGSHVVFGAGRYDPASERGRRLIAHELTHTLQQGGGLRREPVRGKDKKPDPTPVRPPVRVPYGSTDLSKEAIRVRRANPSMSGDANLIIVRYTWRRTDGADPPQEFLHPFWNRPGVAHSEQELDQYIRDVKKTNGSKGELIVSGIFSERQFCGPSSQNCQALVYKSFPNAEKEFAYNYQMPRVDREAGHDTERNVVAARIIAFRDSGQAVDDSTHRDPPPHDESAGGRIKSQAPAPPKQQGDDQATRPPPPAGGKSPIDAHKGTGSPDGKSPMDAHQGTGAGVGKSPMDAHQGTGSAGGKSPMDAHQGTGAGVGKSPMDAHQGIGAGGGKSPIDAHQGTGSSGGKSPIDALQGSGGKAPGSKKTAPPPKAGDAGHGGSESGGPSLVNLKNVGAQLTSQFSAKVKSLAANNPADRDIVEGLDAFDKAMNIKGFLENPVGAGAQAIKTELIQGVFDHFANKLNEVRNAFEAEYRPVAALHADPIGTGVSLEAYERAYDSALAGLRIPEARRTEVYTALFIDVNARTPRKEIDKRLALAKAALARAPELKPLIQQYDQARFNYGVAATALSNHLADLAEELAQQPVIYERELRRRGDALKKAGKILTDLGDDIMKSGLIVFDPIYGAATELQSLGEGFAALGQGLHDFAAAAGSRKADYQREIKRLEAKSAQIQAKDPFSAFSHP